MDIVVTGCIKCPFLYESEECQGDPFDCQHPDGHRIRIKVRGHTPITPDDCPLKAESITISYAERKAIHHD